MFGLWIPVTTVLAETAGNETATHSLPTILITPEWRPVEAQQFAGTVRHYDSAALDRSGIQNTIDLQYKVPSFVFKTNSVLGQPYLRGVGSDFISAGAESSVATFIDGVYLPRAYDTIVDFFDVARVEVIAGPQGVHLGRNVAGGAVSIHTRDPEPVYSGYADVQVGSYDERRIRGALNLPLGDPSLVLRVAGAAAQRDGYVDNVFLGIDENDENYYALRTKLLYAPTPRFSLLLAGEHHREDSSRALGSQPDPGVGANGGILIGGVVPDNPRQVTENIAPDIRIDADRYSARAGWRGDDISLLSTTAFLKTRARLALDLDGTDADYSANYPSGESETLMQEIRASSPTERRLAWTAGVFLLREDAAQRLDVRLPQSGTRNQPDGHVDTRSRAAFAEVAWRFAPAWRTRLGVRHSHDRRTIDLTRTVTNPDGTAVTTQQESRSWEAITPELGLEHTPDPDRLYYATVARGYKAGGFNTSAIQPPFDPEFLLAWEAGFKITLPRQRLRVNAALFYYDYQDLQLNTPPTDAVGAFPRVINAAEASIRGLDLDVLARPWRELELSLGATLLDGRFDDFVSLDPNNPGVDPDRSGNRLPQAPEVSLHAGAGYDWAVDRGIVSLGVEYRYQSAIWFNIYEDPAVRQGAYGLFNAHLAFESHGGRWYAELHGRNLGDRLYAQTILRNDPLTGIKRHWGAPRTVGLRVGYRW